MEEAKILKKGQLIIPVHIRKKLGLKAGDSVKLFDYDGAIHIIPSSKNPVKQSIGILPRQPSLSKHLLNDRAVPNRCGTTGHSSSHRSAGYERG